MKSASVLVLLAFVAAFSLGCEKKGPAEKFGEEVDDAVSSMSREGKEALEKAEDAAHEVAKGAEKVCEEVKEATGAKDTDC